MIRMLKKLFGRKRPQVTEKIKFYPPSADLSAVEQILYYIEHDQYTEPCGQLRCGPYLVRSSAYNPRLQLCEGDTITTMSPEDSDLIRKVLEKKNA